MLLRRPDTCEEAQAYVGTTLKKWWEATAVSDEGWYSCSVQNISDDVIQLDDGTEQEGLWLLLRYDDGDSEEVLWEDAFAGQRDKIRGVRLPEAAIRIGQALSQPKGRRAAMTPTKKKRGPVAEDGAAWPSKRRNALEDSARGMHGERAKVMRADEALAEEAEAALAQAESVRADVEPRVSPSRVASDADPVPDSDEDLPNGAGLVNKASPPQEASSDSDSDGDEVHVEQVEPLRQCQQQRVQAQEKRSQALACQAQPSQAQPSQAANSTQRAHGKAPLLALRAHPKMLPGNGVGSGGQIKRVHAENFMNHKNFEVEFGPHLNFISGENGSGKSATLQCLQVCLGVDARKTGRSTTARGLINDAGNHAVAQVTVWNTGSDPYQYALYGPTLTITRKFTRSGTNTYTLAPHSGKAHNIKAAELHAILDHFSIDASNPVICLTQDHARSFAGSASDESKYKLYMKANGFDAIMERLANAEERLGAFKESLQDDANQIKEKKAQLDKVQQTLKEMAEIDHWQEEVAYLNKCLAWSELQQLREEVADKRQKIEDTAPQQQAELAAAVEEKQQAADAARTAAEEKGEEHSQLMRESSALIEENKGLTKVNKDAEKAARAAKRAAESARAALSDKQAELANCRRAEEEALAQMEQSTQDEVAAHAAQLKAQESAAEGASAAAGCANQRLREAEAALRQAEAGVRPKVDAVDYQQRRVRDLEQDCRQLRGAQGDPIRMFGGEPARRLRENIAVEVRRGSFDRPPIGPIGSLLSLSDDYWAAAVEQAIGKCFDGYLVASRQDVNTLRGVARRSGMGRCPDIILTNFNLPPHDLSRKPQAPPDLTTILSVLKLPDKEDVAKVLFNYLLDSQHVERKVLVPDADTGMKMIRESHRALFRPQQGRGAVISEAWGPDGWKGYARGSSENSQAHQGRINARLQKDVQGQINALEEEIGRAREALQACKDEVVAARREEADAKGEVARCKQERSAAEAARATQQSQLEDLRSERPGAGEDDAADLLAGNRDELARLQGELAELEAQAAEVTAREEAAAGKAAEAKAAFEAAKGANQAALDRNEAAHQAWQAAVRARAEAEGALQAAQEQLRVYEDQVADARAQMLGLEANLATMETEAAKICPEEEAAEARQKLRELWLTTKRARDEDHAERFLRQRPLEDRMHKLQRDIGERERDMGTNLDALRVEEARLSQWYAVKSRAWTKAKELFKSARSSLNKRIGKAEEVREATLQEVNIVFNQYLCMRGNSGSIRVDQTAAKLSIKVKIGNDDKPVQDLKSLSGGERSYVTICFLLALGKKLVANFHCLDEFDVFMDSINRGMALMMLMDFAADQPDTQFILLTPLDLTSINQAATEVLAKRPGNQWPAKKFMTIKQIKAANRTDMQQ